ncbi:MAG: OmpA family protein [Nitrospira sp.]|nr:OmpA family protein [Nitrospira sp.]
MDRRIISLSLSLCIMLFVVGCAGKELASSGDQAIQPKQAKDETIQPDAIKMVPVERSFERPVATVTTPSDNQPVNLSLSSALNQVSEGLKDVFFDYDRFQLRKEALPALDSNAAWLRVNGNKSLLIEGHADERGTLAYNLVLGEKRARAVKRYLLDLGVKPSQLHTTSYGEARPFCKQQNESCYQENRRAHVRAK